MEEIHDRLKRAREARGYRSAGDAAMAMGLREASYRHHENGTRGLTTDRAKTYAKFFKVPTDWLLDGARSGIADPFTGSGKAEGTHIVQHPEAPDQDYSDETMTIGSETGRRGIPVDAIAQLDASGGMGGGGLTIVNEGVPGRHGMQFAAESISDYWRLPSSILAALTLATADVIVLPVKGNSMAPVLLEGDHVFIDTRHRWASPDGVYALADDFDEIIVKTLRAVDSDEGGTWIEIYSENPAYPPRKKRAEEVRIIGRVIRRFSAVF